MGSLFGRLGLSLWLDILSLGSGVFLGVSRIYSGYSGRSRFLKDSHIRWLFWRDPFYSGCRGILIYAGYSGGISFILDVEGFSYTEVILEGPILFWISKIKSGGGLGGTHIPTDRIHLTHIRRLFWMDPFNYGYR